MTETSSPPNPEIDKEQIIALVLVRKKVIDLNQLKHIVSVRDKRGGDGSITDLAVELGFATGKQLAEALADGQSVLKVDPKRPSSSERHKAQAPVKLDPPASMKDDVDGVQDIDDDDIEEVDSSGELDVVDEDIEELDDDEFEEGSRTHIAIDVIDIRPAQLDMAMMRQLPDRFFEFHQIVITKSPKSDARIQLATATPHNLEPVEELRFLTQREVKVVAVSRVSLNRCLGLYAKMKDAAQVDNDEAVVEVVDAENPEEQEAPLLRLVNTVIIEALAREASDIHIEAQEHDIAIRFRVDGVCRLFDRFPKQLLSPIINRIKVMGDMNITERRLPQDGRIEFAKFSKAHDIDLRVSVAPMIHGESAVLRLLDRQRATLPLGRLGFDDQVLKRYELAISAPYGMILHTGPTGSGKSMSLYSALSSMLSEEEKVLTAEDPVEYTLPGINQLQVRPNIGLTFASALRSFLRQDPDIILVGEIRDTETAHMAVEASMTGHKLLSTLHTNDASSTIARLAELGVKSFLLASSLICVCAQRLVRRLCDCSRLGPISEHQREILMAYDNEMRKAYQPVGCELCEDSGYSARFGCFELLVNDPGMQKAILATQSAREIREVAREGGMIPLFEDALFKVKAGLTSVDEVLRVIVPE